MRAAAALLFALAAAAPAVGGCVRRAQGGRSPAPATLGGAADGARSAGRPGGAPPTSGRGGAGDNLAPNAVEVARVLEVGELRQEMQKARGQTLFVHLWATWCGPCIEELPVMDRFARAARARGAVVLSVSLDNDPRGVARVPSVLRGRAPALTALVAHFQDPDQFIGLISSSWEGAIPALFAYDRAGKLQSSLIGEVEPQELERLLRKMNPSP